MFKQYINIRNKLNPFQEPNLDIWQPYINLSMSEFDTTINNLPYRWDRLHGLLDKTGNIDTFFDPKEYGRDCDDFARAWLTWAVFNNFYSREIIVTTKAHLFTKAHVITIINRGSKFYLCNYKHYGPFTSFDKALGYMERFPSYKNGFIFQFGISR
jgi:hypothetical protein